MSDNFLKDGAVMKHCCADILCSSKQLKNTTGPHNVAFKFYTDIQNMPLNTENSNSNFGGWGTGVVGCGSQLAVYNRVKEACLEKLSKNFLDSSHPCIKHRKLIQGPRY